MEVDDDPTVAEVDPSSLEEGFAGEQLKEHLEVLSDETAISHPIKAPFLKKMKPSFLSKNIDPYPFLPDTSNFLNRETPDSDGVQITETRTLIPTPKEPGPRSEMLYAGHLCHQ